MWVAVKRQKIKRDGQYVEVQPGDEIPEAEDWPNRVVWERQGFIRYIPREMKAIEEKKPKSKVEPVKLDIEKMKTKKKAKAKAEVATGE